MSKIEKIKLFIDAHSFDKEHQGTRAYIKRLYVELSKISPNIEFYFGAKHIENLKKELIDIKRCNFIQYSSSSTITRLLFEIPWIVYRNKIDIAHFQYISPIIKNCKHIVTTHDVLFNDFKTEFSWIYRISRNFLFKYSVRRADIKTTVSQFSKLSIHKHFKINLDDICVTPNSISSEYFKKFDKLESQEYIKAKFQLEKYILYVSRFEPRKNHILLLKIYLDLKLYLNGIFLALVGHLSIITPEFDKLYSELPDHIKKYIFISYNVSDSDLYHFYRGAISFVYPSKAEGFGLPPVEAGALKIPVICSNATAMSDFSFFGEYHVDPNDYKLFKNKLEKMLQFPPDANHLNSVSEKISKQYSQTQTAFIFNEALNKSFIRKTKF